MLDCIKRPTTLVYGILLILGILLGLYYLLNGVTDETWDYNIPRRLKIISAILLVSVAVGVSSVIFQTITSNYILTPSIMGLDHLYIFLQTLVIYFWGAPQLVLMDKTSQFVATLLLMIAASGGIFFLMFRGIGKSIYYIVLIGIVFGIAFDGLASFMQVLIDPNEFAMLEGRMFASFNRINVKLLGICWALVALTSAWIFWDWRKYDVMSLGRANAIALGVNYHSLVLKSFLAISILTAASTVMVGPITFLGILIVSLSRLIFRTYRHSVLLTGTVLVGVVMLILGMIVTERVLNFTVPLSVIINLAGGLIFIIMILKSKRI